MATFSVPYFYWAEPNQPPHWWPVRKNMANFTENRYIRLLFSLLGRHGTLVWSGYCINSLLHLVLFVTETCIFGTGNLSVENASSVTHDWVLSILDSESPRASSSLPHSTLLPYSAVSTIRTGVDGDRAREQHFGKHCLAGMSPCDMGRHRKKSDWECLQEPYLRNANSL